MYDRRQRLIEVFEDTQKFYTEDPALASSLAASRDGTKLYAIDEYPALEGAPDREGSVSVTKHTGSLMSLREMGLSLRETCSP